ncbi:cysteine desulfurase family protein [Sphingobacterium yanglingense]|uniref:Cysteine desulfurase IscS n=1 Tax=Sphingobacterium yanglingense TaxID=1437280 RepID=A0A4V3DDL6_9SPHI|nr:cysteine desulfurase family protein [Sphingobacterium yanglingense]TDQ77094.1 cysteine desulfurase IscS [Sphingobacterium yanglingense]
MIYLDNNATSRLDERVLDSMLPYLRDDYANASSLQHKMGRHANQAIEESRRSVSHVLQAQPKEIFFTSGATESINTVLRGVFLRYHSKGNHIITCQTEHKATLSTCEYLEKKGARISYLPVDKNGAIDLDTLKSAITPQTILVSLMSVNNETGVIHPIKDIANICQDNNLLFFCDSTQSIGKQAFDLTSVPLDFCCLSAHKFHGPKGIGALFIRRKSRPLQVESLITGGNQEQALRGGTYNVPAIVGMGTACLQANEVDFSAIEQLRNYFEHRIMTEIDDCTVNAKEAPRICNTSNIMFKHVRGNELMTKMPNIAVSSGSACVSGSRDPSHVLKAMGLTDDEAFCSLRFSLSKHTTQQEIDRTVESLKTAINTIRKQSPIWQMYKDGLLG